MTMLIPAQDRYSPRHFPPLSDLVSQSRELILPATASDRSDCPTQNRAIAPRRWQVAQTMFTRVEQRNINRGTRTTIRLQQARTRRREATTARRISYPWVRSKSGTMYHGKKGIPYRRPRWAQTPLYIVIDLAWKLESTMLRKLLQ